MALDAADKARDRRLRRKLLFVLHESARSSPTGFYNGRRLVDDVNSLMPPGQEIEDDRHALKLLHDLTMLKMVEQKAVGYLRKGQRFSIDFMDYTITSAGVELYEELSPPHPLIEDDRLPREV